MNKEWIHAIEKDFTRAIIRADKIIAVSKDYSNHHHYSVIIHLEGSTVPMLFYNIKDAENSFENLINRLAKEEDSIEELEELKKELGDVEIQGWTSAAAKLRAIVKAAEEQEEIAKKATELNTEAWGALNFILSFYEPQNYLDTNAWKQAEAGARKVHAKLSAAIDKLPEVEDSKLQALGPEVVTLLEKVVDSDMAQREEDEGGHSPLLDHMREVIAKIKNKN